MTHILCYFKEKCGFYNKNGVMGVRYVWLFMGVLGLDLGTKAWVEKGLPLGQRKEIVKKNLYLQHIKNTGFAYHKLAGEKSFILSVTGILTGIYSLFFLKSLRKGDKDSNLSIPLAITLGGAYGNFLERWKKGYVTDFIFIKKGKNPPIFNVADLALFLGSLWVLIASFGKSK